MLTSTNFNEDINFDFIYIRLTTPYKFSITFNYYIIFLLYIKFKKYFYLFWAINFYIIFCDKLQKINKHN